MDVQQKQRLETNQCKMVAVFVPRHFLVKMYSVFKL